MENTEQALSLEAAKDIMANPSNPKHTAWKSGDREVASKIETAYRAAYPEQGPATSPSHQIEVLDANPQSTSPEGSGELSPEAQENLRILREQWGSDFETNAGHVNRAAELFGVRDNHEAMAHLEESGLADDPEFLNAAANLGRIIASKGR